MNKVIVKLSVPKHAVNIFWMIQILIYLEREGMLTTIRVYVNESRCNNVLIDCQLKCEV